MTAMKFPTNSPSDTILFDDDVMQMLDVSKETLVSYVKVRGLPAHQVTDRSQRWFLYSEVLDWVKSRCTSPAPGQVA